MQTWQTYLVENSERFLAELKDFLRIPSISALPAHAGDVQEAAEWVAHRMHAAGIEHIEILPTGGHPVVYGDWLHAPGAPTVLIYGHFDTQPVDPLELWTSPPFEPVIKEGRIYARGASDNKGNMLTPILAIEALLSTEGALPVNVKFFFEGQEEIGAAEPSQRGQAPLRYLHQPVQRDLLRDALAALVESGERVLRLEAEQQVSHFYCPLRCFALWMNSLQFPEMARSQMSSPASAVRAFSRRILSTSLPSGPGPPPPPPSPL